LDLSVTGVSRRTALGTTAALGALLGLGRRDALVTPAAAIARDVATPAAGQDASAAPAFYALAGDAAEAIWFLGCLALIKGDGRRTGNALAAVEFLHPRNFATPLHVHHTADEAFVMLSGTIRGVCGEHAWQASTGAFVWLPRGMPHGYAVEGHEPVRTLAMTLPAGFDRFVVEAGEPAKARTLPPPSAPDIDKLVAVGLKYGIENVGPPVQFSSTPAAAP
jgi:mannose-6-phosphate isomerase-like protein (cupin superfamily)